MSGAKEYYDRLLSGQERPPEHVATAMRDIMQLGVGDGDSYDWIPSERLYALYAKCTAPPHAGKQDFGLALHLCFPNAEKVTRRRAGDGKTCRGWSGIKGPHEERAVDPADNNTRRRG